MNGARDCGVGEGLCCVHREFKSRKGDKGAPGAAFFSGVGGRRAESIWGAWSSIGGPRFSKGCSVTKAVSLRVSASLVLAIFFASSGVAQPAARALPKVAKVSVNAPVTLTDNGTSWTLDNGVVKATLGKADGNLSSIVYHGVEVLDKGRYNYWEQKPAGAITAKVTIDPASNGGERAEVSVKGVNGRMDIESRFAMERGTSGFYVYNEYTHHASYPRAGEGESRFILQDLNPDFDWLSVDKDRNRLMPINVPENHEVHAKEQSIYTEGVYKNTVEHKYSYNAPMYKLQAWGWSSTKDHIGVYFINPSTEYIVGGPERLDLIDHMSAPGSAKYEAIILDYWTSGHYGGGASNSIAAGEEWTHVVGPIFVYFNSIAAPKDPSPAEMEKFTGSFGSAMPAVPAEWNDNSLALWNDAVAESKVVKAAWPYAWVEGMDYPHKDGRGTVTGQLVLDDAQAKSKQLANLNVGLTHANYAGNASARAGNGNIVTWPHDGEHYQFWTVGTADGRFTLANVRPGTYTLRAFADGVLGEYDREAEVTVEAGKSVNLGKLDWKPVRYGRQVWEIGYPDRTGDKFFKGDGDNYWQWGWGLRYSGLFPHDITYTIGKSDYHKDWFFQETPHATSTAWLNPEAKDPYNQRFGWVAIPAVNKDPWPQWGQGRANTWTVKFNMPKAAKGQAVLRVALAGADGGNGNEASSPGNLTIGVNGQTAGTIHTIATNALRYNTNKGVWNQYIQPFDASLLKVGENEMTFTVASGDVTTGVVWDYLRLELNDGTGVYPVAPNSERPDYPTLPGAVSAQAQ
jgi:rhamnogalacturonan endolyase